MTIPFAGGCACGAIRYQATAAPLVSLHCHCLDCQKSSGGPAASFVVVPTEAFQIRQGTLRFFATPSEMGGHTNRGFCAECGTPVMGQPEGALKVVAIRATSLDDPTLFQPQMDVWTSDAPAWDRLDPAIPKFEKYPSM